MPIIGLLSIECSYGDNFKINFNNVFNLFFFSIFPRLRALSLGISCRVNQIKNHCIVPVVKNWNPHKGTNIIKMSKILNPQLVAFNFHMNIFEKGFEGEINFTATLKRRCRTIHWVVASSVCESAATSQASRYELRSGGGGGGVHHFAFKWMVKWFKCVLNGIKLSDLWFCKWLNAQLVTGVCTLTPVHTPVFGNSKCYLVAWGAAVCSGAIKIIRDCSSMMWVENTERWFIKLI